MKWSRPLDDEIQTLRARLAGLRWEAGSRTLDAITGSVMGILAWAEQRGDVHEFEFNPILADPSTATVTVVDAVVSIYTNLEGVTR